MEFCSRTSPGKNTGVGSHSLLRGIFPTQGWNPGLPHCRRVLYQLSPQGNTAILEWIAYPFCSGSSRPRSWTGVSCIAGGFFPSWVIRAACGTAHTSVGKIVLLPCGLHLLSHLLPDFIHLIVNISTWLWPYVTRCWEYWNLMCD